MSISTNGTVYDQIPGHPIPPWPSTWLASQSKDSILELCDQTIRELMNSGEITCYKQVPSEPYAILLYTPQRHLCKILIQDTPSLHVQIIGYRIDVQEGNVKHTNRMLVELGDVP